MRVKQWVLSQRKTPPNHPPGAHWRSLEKAETLPPASSKGGNAAEARVPKADAESYARRRSGRGAGRQDAGRVSSDQLGFEEHQRQAQCGHALRDVKRNENDGDR